MARASQPMSVSKAGAQFWGCYDFLSSQPCWLCTRRRSKPDCCVKHPSSEKQVEIVQPSKVAECIDGSEGNLDTLSQAETTDAGFATPQSLAGFESEDSEDTSEAPIKDPHAMDFRRSFIHKLSQEKVLVPSEKRLKKHQTVIIFDWDDTLLCTSWLNRREAYGQPLSGSDGERLLGIERTVKELLEKALKVGCHACIITNAKTGWVEYSAAQYAPDLLPVLEQIQIISARDAYEQSHPSDPRMWKILAFRDLQQRLHLPVITNLISMGDRDYEMDATQIIGQEFSTALVKTIKMRENPSPDVLLKQLKLINSKFERIVLNANNLQIGVEKKSTEATAEA